MCGSAGAGGGLRQGGPVYMGGSSPLMTMPRMPPQQSQQIQPTMPRQPTGIGYGGDTQTQPMMPQQPQMGQIGAGGAGIHPTMPFMPQQPQQPMGLPSGAMPQGGGGGIGTQLGANTQMQQQMPAPMQPRPFVGQSPQGTSPAFSAGNVTGGVTTAQPANNPFAMLFGGY